MLYHLRRILLLLFKLWLKNFRLFTCIYFSFYCCIYSLKGFAPVIIIAFKTLQTPKSTVEVKDLIVDISKDGGSKPALVVKLHILPIFVHIGEPRVSCDQSSNLNTGDFVSGSQESFALTEKSSAPFSCEEFSLTCEFGHNR